MQTASETRWAGKKLTLADLMRRIKQGNREHQEHAAAVAALCVFTALLFAPLLSGKTFSMVASHMFGQYPWVTQVKPDPEVTGLGYPQTDHAETFYPNSVFVTNAIRSGQLPMWFPYSFAGAPLLELGLTGWLYPPRLLAVLFMEPIQQHDFLLFTHLLFAGLGMYGLLRLLGANVFGAIFGAMVWELNGHNMFWLVLEHVAFAAMWLPLMLLAATLAIRRQSLKWAVASGAALGMSLLTGSLHYAYLNALALAGWYAVLTAIAAGKLLLAGKQRSALACIALPVCSAIVALALSAVCWLPFTEQLSYVHRESPTLEVQLSEAMAFGNFAGALVWPRSAAGPAGMIDIPSFAYTGIITVALAVAAVVLALIKPRRFAPVAVGLVLCLLSLGFALGVAPLISALRLAIPYFSTLHPHAGFYIFCFGMGVLAAFGMTEAGRLLARARLPHLLIVAAGCALVFSEAAHLASFARRITPAHPKRAEWLLPETNLIKTLQSLQGSYHILPVYYRHPKGQWTPPVFAGKVAANFDLRSGSGYESLLPLHTALLWRTIEQGGALGQNIPPAYRPYFYHDKLPIELLEKVSVGLLAAPPNVLPRDVHGVDLLNSGALQLVYEGMDGWIYKVNRALPRAFLVPRVVAAPDAQAALKMLADRSFNAREAAIVIGEQAVAHTRLPSDDSQSADFNATATIISDRLNDVEIEAYAPRAAMMVLNDSWAAGWKAYVDGVEQTVLQVNYAFRGVVVPEGKHRVLFLYRPFALLIGLIVSTGTLLIIIALYVVDGLRTYFRFYSSRKTPPDPQAGSPTDKSAQINTDEVLNA